MRARIPQAAPHGARATWPKTYLTACNRSFHSILSSSFEGDGDPNLQSVFTLVILTPLYAHRRPYLAQAAVPCLARRLSSRRSLFVSFAANSVISLRLGLNGAAALADYPHWSSFAPTSPKLRTARGRSDAATHPVSPHAPLRLACWLRRSRIRPSLDLRLARRGIESRSAEHLHRIPRGGTTTRC